MNDNNEQADIYQINKLQGPKKSTLGPPSKRSKQKPQFDNFNGTPIFRQIKFLQIQTVQKCFLAILETQIFEFWTTYTYPLIFIEDGPKIFSTQWSIFRNHFCVMIMNE